MASAPTAETVLRDLRRRRASLRHRPRGMELVAWAEVVAMLLGYAALGLWLLVGGPPITGRPLDLVRSHGAAAAGLGAVLIVGLSLRSGLRGGPLAMERADVQHLLLAPVGRRAVLLPPAMRRLAAAMGMGAVAGGIAGLLTGARLPGGYPAWGVAGAATGALAAALTVAPAMIVSGRRLRERWVYLAWLALVALAVADLVAGTALTPPSWLGLVAVWALAASPLAALALVAVGAVAAIGLAGVAGTSVEALDRRSGLVAEMRFAAATRDVRSLTRTGHQLAEETPRERPWLRLPGWFGGGVWRRHWQSLLRWPLARVARVGAIGIAIAAALALVWVGASYFLVVAGALAYVVGLEVLEPWAQAADRPDLTASLPVSRGWLLARHLPAAVVAATVAGLVPLAAVAALRPAPAVLAAAAILLPAAATAAV
ncbi:MAG TPA: hypothetical protein VOB72_12670, partial [Candidatus Dormibacteraeota bacterium]|nr:hypothetical protein [Candidatus Dormibacteraeota bacterium]